MTECYLRLEGVNLGNFVYDTNNLSTVRGGGLLLLNAVGFVEQTLETEQLLIDKGTISKGASWGLYRVRANDTHRAEDIPAFVLEKLNQSKHYKHATFVADILPVTDDYKKDRNQLAALNHWQQMQAPSLAFPGEGEQVCALDKVRPANQNEYLPGDDKKKQPVSDSTRLRWKHGKDQKKAFHEEIARLENLQFTQDLDKLSDNADDGILNHKIAVIYIDGNGFGDFQKKHCTDETAQRNFDSSVRKGQETILKGLITTAANDNQSNDWKYKDAKGIEKIRWETLLWGGDEIIWVVPAWKGWDVLNQFYAKAKGQIQYKDSRKKKYKLKHAAGLVFCHQNAPIHRITRLAKDLAEFGKEKDREKNLIALQVLESFDHAGSDLKKWRQNRVANLADPADLLIEAEKMKKIQELIRQLKELPGFPRRKAYQMLQAQRSGQDKKANSLKEKLDKDYPESKPILEALAKQFGSQTILWLQLIDLWEYVG